MIEGHKKIVVSGKEFNSEEELIQYARNYVERRLIELKSILRREVSCDVSPPYVYIPPTPPLPPISPMSKAATLLNKLKKKEEGNADECKENTLAKPPLEGKHHSPRLKNPVKKR